jgi:ABC-type uncharacterized transport system auxiliary subunit
MMQLQAGLKSPARVAVMAALLPLMVACSGMLKSNAPDEQVYVLHPAAAAAGAAPVNAMLVVPQPEVQPALNTPRIALTQPGNRLDYFANSRWGAALPQELAALAVQSLIASKTFSVVAGTDPSAGGGDFQLLLTVRHFEAEYSGDPKGLAPVARVSIECLLTGDVPRRVLGRCDAQAQEPARENRMSEIVAALDVATQHALSEIAGKAATLAASVTPRK